MEDMGEPAEEPGDMGGSPLPPGPPMDAGAGLPPEATGPPMDGPKNFADASALALEDLKKKKAKA